MAGNCSGCGWEVWPDGTNAATLVPPKRLILRSPPPRVGVLSTSTTATAITAVTNSRILGRSSPVPDLTSGDAGEYSQPPLEPFFWLH